MTADAPRPRSACELPGSPVSDRYRGQKVLVTGGLGFIGSNLAIRLVELGAQVSIVDAMIPGYGGNFHNIAPVKDDVLVNLSNICDEYSMNHLVQGQGYIFHLASQVSHMRSIIESPYLDIEFNVRGTAVLMEAVRRYNPDAVVVRAGTRGQYGPAARLPVSETTPSEPRGIYEISHLSAEQIMRAYARAHQIRVVPLRLTNTYGPRAQMKTDHYGVANWFIRLALEGRPIPIFGDGKIKRDFLYVADAVDAMLRSAGTSRAWGQVLNVGCDAPSSFLEFAELVMARGGRSSLEFVDFSEERKAQEPGDYYSDISKIRALVGWEPVTPLARGIDLTLAYYTEHRRHYW